MKRATIALSFCLAALGGSAMYNGQVGVSILLAVASGLILAKGVFEQ